MISKENTIQVEILKYGVKVDDNTPYLGKKIQFSNPTTFDIGTSRVSLDTSYRKSGFSYFLNPFDFENVLPKQGPKMPDEKHYCGSNPVYAQEFFGRPVPYFSALYLGDWRRSKWKALMDSQEQAYDPNKKLGDEGEMHAKTVFSGPMFRSKFYGSYLFDYWEPTDPDEAYSARSMVLTQLHYRTEWNGNNNHSLTVNVVTEADEDKLIRVEESEIMGIYNDPDRLANLVRGLAVVNIYLTRMVADPESYPWMKKGFSLEQMSAFWNFLYNSYNYSFESAEDKGFGPDIKERYAMDYRAVKRTLPARDLTREINRLKSSI